MTTNNLIQTLKESGQDYEFYPTTSKMIETIACRIFNERSEDAYFHNSFWGPSEKYKTTIYDKVYLYQNKSSVDILDIGAGNGNFKSEFEKFVDGIETKDHFHYEHCSFYGIEKSRILLERLMENGYSIIGTDFDEITLIDKGADIVFCNPPYSVYENWTYRIITEISADYIFLIIPERWKENPRIKKCLEETNSEVEILMEGDFLEAERSARAKINVLLIKRNLKENECFDRWFEQTFEPAQEMKPESDEEHTQRLGNEMVQAESQIDYLVNSYNGEMQKLLDNYRAICKLDSELLEEIGLKKEQIKKSFLEKINGLKKVYWTTVFNKLEPITYRLTYRTRSELQDRFVRKRSVDFTAGNIYMILIWVCKNASEYYDDQIRDFYLNLSDDENVIPYKSNQRVFKREEHRWSVRYGETPKDPYLLDYRIVTRNSVIKHDFDYYNWDMRHANLHDLIAIARTMGFTISGQNDVRNYGEKGLVFDGSDHIFCEFRIYKNGNTHLKLNREFVTALNVYIGRKFGWLKDKSDIAKNFPEDVVKQAEKYFDYSTAITMNNVPLLN